MSAINKHMKNTNTGFTLIELMVTLAVAAIVITMGVPSFADFIVSNRMTANANNLIASLNMARSEAIKRGETTSVCISSDQATCTGSNWKDGWIITDSSANVLRVFDSLPGGSTLTNADSLTTIQFKSTGFLNGSATSFSLCDSGRTGEDGRTITVSATGRPGNTTPYPTCS